MSDEKKCEAVSGPDDPDCGKPATHVDDAGIFLCDECVKDWERSGLGVKPLNK